MREFDRGKLDVGGKLKFNTVTMKSLGETRVRARALLPRHNPHLFAARSFISFFLLIDVDRFALTRARARAVSF